MGRSRRAAGGEAVAANESSDADQCLGHGAPSGGDVRASFDAVLISLSLREWRNWQTRTVQVRVPVRAWGFKSPLAHRKERKAPGISGGLSRAL